VLYSSRRDDERALEAPDPRHVLEAALSLRLEKISRVDSIDNRSGVLEGASLALGAAHPASVQKPRGGVVLRAISGTLLAQVARGGGEGRATCCNLSASIVAYLTGCHTKKGSP